MTPEPTDPHPASPAAFDLSGASTAAGPSTLPPPIGSTLRRRDRRRQEGSAKLVLDLEEVARSHGFTP